MSAPAGDERIATVEVVPVVWVGSAKPVPSVRARSSRMMASRRPRSCSIFAAKHCSSRNKPKSRCPVPIHCVGKPFGFLGGVGQHSLALIGQWQVDGSGYLLPDGAVVLDLLADSFSGTIGLKVPMGERPVFAEKAEQHVFGLDVGSSELTGFVACKEDYTAGLFCVSFEHSIRCSPSHLNNSRRRCRSRAESGRRALHWQGTPQTK